ncbi:MAG: histidine phosphatase family protein [Acidimicrobiales bacterium]
MELILVRHGQPAWATPEGLGRNDPGLTAHGRAQAEAVAARLADPADEPAPGPVDRLLASPALRAAETAAPIGEALALPVETLNWLWEIRNPPEWEGSPIEDIEAAFEAMRQRSLRELWDGIGGGGEPIKAFHDRIIDGLHGLLGKVDVTPTGEAGLWSLGPSAPQRMVAVAHGGTNSVIIANLLGIAPEPWEWDRFRMGHASVAVLRAVPLAGANLWSLQSLGDAAHLPVPDRTF